jgi:Cell Wall Hydrolase
MIIKRAQPPRIGGRTKTKSFVLLGVALLTISSVSSVQARYQPIPGKRGSVVSIKLDAPMALNAPNYQSFGANASPYANDQLVNAPVPMPEMINPAIYRVPATPPATPSGTPFVMPRSENSGVSASPYLFATHNPTDSMRAAICLTTAIYYEAASESDDGQRAVAQVILNRVRHPSWPNTVCGVVYQGSDGAVCQFSYACDGAMARRPSVEGWARASRIARAALSGFVYAPAGLSTFYHTPQVNPSWNKRLIVAHVIGNHIFYRMPGNQGAPTAFADRYVGGEPLPAPKPRAYTPPAYAAAKTGQFVPMPTGPYAAVPTPAIATAAVPMPAPVATYRTPTERITVRDDSRYVQGALPESDVLPAYRESGSWIK